MKKALAVILLVALSPLLYSCSSYNSSPNPHEGMILYNNDWITQEEYAQIKANENIPEPEPAPIPETNHTPSPTPDPINSSSEDSNHDTNSGVLQPEESDIDTQELKASDFAVAIISTRQANVTNYSEETVLVCGSQVKYKYYSYINYNMPGRPNPDYGPVVNGTLTSDESTQLLPGRTFTKTLSRDDIVSITSCTFTICYGDGEQLTVQ